MRYVMWMQQANYRSTQPAQNSDEINMIIIRRFFFLFLLLALVVLCACLSVFEVFFRSFFAMSMFLFFIFFFAISLFVFVSISTIYCKMPSFHVKSNKPYTGWGLRKKHGFFSLLLVFKSKSEMCSRSHLPALLLVKLTLIIHSRRSIRRRAIIIVTM